MIQLIRETICTYHDGSEEFDGDGDGDGDGDAAVAAATGSNDFDDDYICRDDGGKHEDPQQRQASKRSEKNTIHDDGGKKNESTPLLLLLGDDDNSRISNNTRKSSSTGGDGGVRSRRYSSIDDIKRDGVGVGVGGGGGSLCSSELCEKDVFQSLDDMVFAYDGLLFVLLSDRESLSSSSPTLFLLLLRRFSDFLTFIVVWMFPFFVITVVPVAITAVAVFANSAGIMIEQQQQSDLNNNHDASVDDDDDESTNSEMFSLLAAVGASSMLVFFWTVILLWLQSTIEHFETFGRHYRNRTSSSSCFCCGGGGGGGRDDHYDDESVGEDDTSYQYREFVKDVLRLVESLDGPEWSSALEYKLHPNAADAVVDVEEGGSAATLPFFD